ncbi:hypothetical protein ABPG74_009118 [Tetrahymena malaccensis]
MDQKDEKKHGGGYNKQNLQGTDQLIKDITLISVTQGSKMLSNWDQIKKYKLDNNRIKEKINFVVKKNEIEDITQKQKIQKIQEQGQQWTKKILIELERQELLRKEIDKVQQNIQQKNLKVGQGQHQIGQQISEQEQISQQRKQYQQKLDKLKAKNNKMIAEIQKLKEEVKISRNERAFFDNVFKNLERDMKQKEELIKQFVLDNTLNGYELKKQEEVNVMITKLMEKEQQLFKIAYESQMLSKPNEIYNIEELTSSIQVDNSKIKETLDEEDEEEEENNFESKLEPNQTQNLSRIQEMKYENFLKLKKELIAKVNNDKAECDNKSEQIKKLLLMTNTESIEQFKLDYKKNEDQIEEHYKQSEYLNGEISSLRKQIQEIETEISNYQEQKEDLIRQMDQKKQITSEKDRLIRDIKQIQDTQKRIKENNIQIEEDLYVFCKLIPPMLRELNVMSDEFLRENIHMNIHPNNVLDFFGTIEKKTTLTNVIYNRLQETKFANVRKSKKKMTLMNTQTNTTPNNNSTTRLPFNYVKIMDREKKQKQLIDYLDKMDQEKEADSLMMPSHFKLQCQVDFSKLNQNPTPQKQFNQVRDSIRVLSHFQTTQKKKNGVK